MIEPSLIFQEILMAVIFTLVFAWLAIRLAYKIGLVDYPSKQAHKQHLQATPIAGGIALAATLLFTEGVYGLFRIPEIRATLIAGSIVFLFGLIDDLRCLPPVVKLAGQIIAAVVLIRLGVYIRIFESPEFFLHRGTNFDIIIDWLITILWIVGMTNAFNFVDSMDGLAVGLGGLAASFFLLVTMISQQTGLAQHSAFLIGACLALYFFNAPPALLFIGDSGAQFIGFALAVLAIAFTPQDANQSSSWFIPILLLGVPIFDASLVIISRARRKLPIYRAGRDHTYHRLKNMGLGQQRAVLIMHGAALILGCMAFIVLPQRPLIANLFFALICLAGLGAIFYLDRSEYWKRHHV